MWALGCIVILMLTGKLPFFLSPKDLQDPDFCVDEIEQEEFVMQRHREWVQSQSFCIHMHFQTQGVMRASSA